MKSSISGADMIFKLSGDESKQELKVLIDSFELNDLISTLFLQTPKIDKTWKTFCDLYLILEAAGGIVINDKDSLLMIFRNGKWDLPKGKIEKGEESDTAAIREVFEECGVSGLSLKKQLNTTFHTYPYKDEKILKKTFWFLMNTSDSNKLIPQLEEGITEARWLTRGQVKEAMRNTYLSIADLLNEQIFDDANDLLG
jgi:8-oxo-dGTP pyrophosphatase MutT (NUDIX family)